MKVRGGDTDMMGREGQGRRYTLWEVKVRGGDTDMMGSEGQGRRIQT